MNRLKLFLQEAKQEFYRINWPSLRETVNLTLIVVLFSIGLSVFLGAADLGFSYLLRLFLFA